MQRRAFLQTCTLGAAASLAALPALAASSSSNAPVAPASPVASASSAPAAPAADAIEREPVIKIKPAAPVIVSKIEVLRAGSEYFIRTTARDGSVGLAVCEGDIKTYAPILKTFIIPWFLGKDARDLETLIDGVYVYNSNYKKTGLIFWSCVAWVEFSLLDLLGQAAGKSIGALFGGPVKTELDTYVSSTTRETTPQQEVANFQQRLAERGGHAVKYKIGGRMSGNEDAAPGRSEGLVALAARTFGDKIAQYADANGSYDAARAIEIGKMLEAHGVGWYEEPCPFEDFEQTRAVADALAIPVACGEQDTSLPKMRWMIANRALDVVQADIVYNGGFVRTWRLGRLAARAGLPLTLHNTKTGIHAVYMIHFASAALNAGRFQEYHIDPEKPDGWASFPIRVKGGKVPVPRAPGKGFEVDPAFLRGAVVI